MKAYDSYLMLKLPLCGNKWTKTIEKKREIQNSDGINRPHSQTLVQMRKWEMWMRKNLDAMKI